MATDSTLRNTGNCSPQALIWNVLEHLSQTYLVIQWLRIHLPMRGAWVRSLVWEDSTSHGQLSPCTTTPAPTRSREAHGP